MSNWRLTVYRIIERLGLDWLVLLAGKPAFEDPPSPYPTTFLEIRKKFGDLRDTEKLDDALGYCTGLLNREEKRLDKIEAKAFTLIRITSIATGLITGLTGLFLSQEQITSAWLLILILYVLAIASLLFTIFLANKVVTVGDYWSTYPSANDIFKLSNATLHYVRRERVVSLFYSFAQNQRMVNRKATFLRGAQHWFKNALTLLLTLTLTLLLALYIPFRLSTSTPAGTSAPTVTPSPIQPTIVPTDTPQSSFTPTVVVPTNTPVVQPAATIQPSPTFTYTLTP